MRAFVIHMLFPLLAIAADSTLTQLSEQLPGLVKLIKSAPPDGQDRFLKSYQGLCEKGAYQTQKVTGKQRSFYCYIMSHVLTEQEGDGDIVKAVERTFKVSLPADHLKAREMADKYLEIGSKELLPGCSKTGKEGRDLCKLYSDYSFKAGKHVAARKELLALCEKKKTAACFVMAQLSEAEGDKPATEAYYQKACDAGERVGCLKAIAIR